VGGSEKVDITRRKKGEYRAGVREGEKTVEGEPLKLLKRIGLGKNTYNKLQLTAVSGSAKRERL